jgi:hypothetical protein
VSTRKELRMEGMRLFNDITEQKQSKGCRRHRGILVR